MGEWKGIMIMDNDEYALEFDEQWNNPDFNTVEFDGFRKEAGNRDGVNLMTY